MNPIISYYEEMMKGKEQVTEEVLGPFNMSIELSTVEEILEAFNLVVATVPGVEALLECYNTVQVPEPLIDKHRDHLNKILDSSIKLTERHETALLECVSRLNQIDEMYSSSEFIFENSLQHFTDVLNKMENDIVLEGANIDWTDEKSYDVGIKKTKAEFNLAFTNFFLTPDKILEKNPDLLLEFASKMIKVYNDYNRICDEREAVLEQMGDIVTEANKPGYHVTVKNKNGQTEKGHDIDNNGKPSRSSSGQSSINKAAVKLDEKSRKASANIRKGASDIKKTGNIVSKSTQRFTSLIGDTVGKLNKLNKEQRMEAILTGGMRRRVSNLVRTAITTGAATAIHPALGVITLLTSATLRKSSDDRLKKEVLAEYEGELKLVKEKIRDAESAGDRKKKYELMRIENHLEQNIERINSPFRTNKPKLKKG